MPRAPLFPWKTSNISTVPEEVRLAYFPSHPYYHIDTYHICCANSLMCVKVKCYEEDDLTHCGMMKPAWAASMMKSMALVASSLHKISLPVLLIHGARDPIISYSSSEFIYNSVSSEDKTFLVGRE